MTASFPKILGLIPARKGSKGVPGKNMKLLGGMPLIQYTIESARQSELLGTILVSTDCPEIVRFVSRFDRIVAPFTRPADLATDHTPMIEVVKHALSYAEHNIDRFEYVLLLQPTCPFRKPGMIDDTIRHVVQQQADSLITVRKIPDSHNPFWAFILQNNELQHVVSGTDRPTRRQDLAAAYYRDGEIYIARTSLIRTGEITGGKIAGWLNDNEFDINIDTPADWIRAETLLNQWKHQTKNIFSY